MPHEVGKHPGAVWYKCDFQCHSPRDRAWDGLPELPGGNAALETERDTWASDFIAQCLALKLGVVSVTDHHDTTFIPYVCKAAENSSVLVLPGIEVTCSDAAQCLALFDPSCGADTLSYFIGKLKDINVAPPTDAKTVAITAANITVSDLFREVYTDARLRDTCVLLPHFSDGDAHKHLNEAKHNIRFSKLECDGVYIEKKYEELLPETLKKIYGEIPEWGTRRRGVIPTGDNRKSTWDRLGVNDCWIKLGESSIEAVRQALLADDARIAYTSPDEPTERVVSIEIKTTLTGPKAVTMTFNPGFNALVGGRGSGKSSILEYLRFGLARTARDFGSSSEREEELINDTLVDGYVAVVIEREGVRETWHRTLDEEKISVFHADGSENYLTLAEARRRFRGRAFHQKQLSTTTKEAESAADQITGIAAAETLDRRRELEQNIKNAQRASTTLLQGAAAYWQTELEYAQSIVRVDDLKKRITNINERMKEGGISPEDLALIASAPLFTRGQSYLGQVKKQLETERARLNAIVTTALNIPMDQFSEVESFAEINTLIEGVKQTGTAIAQHMSHALQELAVLARTHEQSALEFRTRYDEFSRLHAAAVERQKAHKALLDENERLRKELTAAEANAAELAAKLSSAQRAGEDFEAGIAKLDALVTERREVLSQAADQVAAKSSGLLKARLKKDPSPGSYISSLTALAEGAGLPDAEARIQTWIEGELDTDSDSTWSQIREKLLAIYRAKIGAGISPYSMAVAPDSSA